MDNDDEVEEILKKSTVKDDLPISVSGRFASQEEAHELYGCVLGTTKFFGTVFDLSGLDGITIADDYQAALKSIERGYPGMKAPTPTRNQFGSGEGMVVPVLRGGEKKSHVVLNSALVRPLVNQEDPQYLSALHWLCHELAHVYDHMLRNNAMPNFYGSMTTDARECILRPLATAGWDEYAASRLSAPWGAPEYTAQFEQALVSMLDTMLHRTEAAQDAFALHENVDLALKELGEIFGSFFVCAAYLAGHVDGMNRELHAEAPQLTAKLKETKWVQELMHRYLYVLRKMFAEIDHWAGEEAYDPLKELFETVLLFAGMKLTKSPEGTYRAHFGKIVCL